MKTKIEFKHTLYIFHNWVNVKKRKPLFNYSNINVYGGYPLIPVINNFIEKYKTKGNMSLLADSFQRILIIKDLKNFIKRTINAFLPLPLIQPIIEEITVEEIERNIEESIEIPIKESIEFKVEEIDNELDPKQIKSKSLIEKYNWKVYSINKTKFNFIILKRI